MVASPVDSNDEGTWTVAIFAQTDSRAELMPCHCPGLKTGGLALRSAVFGRARALTFPAIVVDAGDFIPADGESLRTEFAELMLDAMEIMEYDAVSLGGLELQLGHDFVARAAKRLPLVCANLKWEEEGAEIPKVRWIEDSGRKVAVSAYVDPLLYYDLPGIVDNLAERILVLDPVESLQPVLDEVRPEADLVVLLAHADLPRIRELLDQLSGFDVVVQGHAPEETEPLVRFEGVDLMVPGPRSRQVAQLTLVLNADNTVRDRRARVWNLSRLTKGDRRLDDLVREFQDVHGNP
jgi:2',3'-cyclic-nucleotide 2'-phosphodiesterase (5'-nucleotidase family)